MALLNVDKLSVHFGDESAPFRAVDRISYSVKQGGVSRGGCRGNAPDVY